MRSIRSPRLASVYLFNGSDLTLDSSSKLVNTKIWGFGVIKKIVLCGPFEGLK
jgi:hypothetical protein